MHPKPTLLWVYNRPLAKVPPLGKNTQVFSDKLGYDVARRK